MTFSNKISCNLFVCVYVCTLREENIHYKSKLNKIVTTAKRLEKIDLHQNGLVVAIFGLAARFALIFFQESIGVVIILTESDET